MFNIKLDRNIFHSNWSYFLTLERNDRKNSASLIRSLFRLCVRGWLKYETRTKTNEIMNFIKIELYIYIVDFDRTYT